MLVSQQPASAEDSCYFFAVSSCRATNACIHAMLFVTQCMHPFLTISSSVWKIKFACVYSLDVLAVIPMLLRMLARSLVEFSFL